MKCLEKPIEKTKKKTKDNISTGDTDTVKGETHSNIRGCNGRSKRQRKVASNRPGPKLDCNQRIEGSIVVVV